MLTIEQELYVEQVKRQLAKAPREDLESIAIAIVKQQMEQKNLFLQILKGERKAIDLS